MLKAGICKEYDVGTPGFQAPEVLQQPCVYGTAADMWSFGATMKQKYHSTHYKPLRSLIANLLHADPADRMSTEEAITFLTQW